MAIAFPRAIPSGLRFVRSQFTLRRNDVIAQTQGGGLQAMELGEPLWVLSAQTGPLRWSQRRELSAWNTSLRGASRRILAYDWIGSYPIAYGVSVLALARAAGGAFDGTAILNSYTSTTLTLSTLPAGYQALAGDRLSFPWNEVRAFHEVIEDAVANGSGVVTVTVEPPVRTNPTPGAGAAVDLVRPPCVMVIRPETFSVDEGPALAPVSFEALQVLA